MSSRQVNFIPQSTYHAAAFKRLHLSIDLSRADVENAGDEVYRQSARIRFQHADDGRAQPHHSRSRARWRIRAHMLVSLDEGSCLTRYQTSLPVRGNLGPPRYV